MGVTKEQFYNPELFSIMGMGFCYPGKAASGDLPPRPECAKLWHGAVLEQLMPMSPLIILAGQYAQKYYLGKRMSTLTDNVRNFNIHLPAFFVLPHPSPRNRIWLKKNSWFEQEIIPKLQEKVHERLYNGYP
jgi:uracil-DNA glycosylase